MCQTHAIAHARRIKGPASSSIVVATTYAMAWKYFLSENAILPLQIFLIAALCNTATPCLYDTEDALMLYPNGTDVVQAVISKLHSLHFKMCDRHLLRRIALVETADGTSIKLGGGIWALNESKFSNVAKELHEVLRNKLCWNVTDDMLYDLLGQPLVSGLAATLYLNYLKNNRSARIPLPGNITGQAQFWRNYYHSRNLTEDYFVEQVKGFECKCYFK